METKKKKRIRISIGVILSMFAYVSLYLQGFMALNHTISFFMFVIILLAYLKSDIGNKEYCKDFIVLSIFLGFLYTIGKQLYEIRYVNHINYIREFLRIKSMVSWIGNSAIIYLVLINVIPAFLKYNIFTKEKESKRFLLTTTIILLGWLPYYILFFPGILTFDSLGQLRMINGLQLLTNHHPVISTVFMAIPYKIVYAITKNVNIAVGAISLTQMILMACIFSYTLSFLRKRNVNIKVRAIILAYFTLFPVNALYSITLWKDILFSGLILLLTLELIKITEKKDQLTLKNTVSFIIISILTNLFRNNAIYMYFILIIITMIVFRKQWKYFVKAFAIILVSYFMISGPVYNYFRIEKSSSTEYIAIPLQQIGRMAYKNVKFNKKETKLLNNLIGVEILRKNYNAEIVDSIKFHKKYDVKVFDNHKGEYLKMWAGLCIKHFDIATEAYLISTLGYWYPDTTYWISTARIDENDMEIKNLFFSDSLREKVAKVLTRSLPVVGILYSIGFCFWLIILSIYFCIKKKNKIAIYSMVPVLGIWFTMMIAAPVFSEFRYVYCMFTTVPVLLLVSRIIKTSKKA